MTLAVSSGGGAEKDLLPQSLPSLMVEWVNVEEERKIVRLFSLSLSPPGRCGKKGEAEWKKVLGKSETLMVGCLDPVTDINAVL